MSNAYPHSPHTAQPNAQPFPTLTSHSTSTRSKLGFTFSTVPTCTPADRQPVVFRPDPWNFRAWSVHTSDSLQRMAHGNDEMTGTLSCAETGDHDHTVQIAGRHLMWETDAFRVTLEDQAGARSLQNMGPGIVLCNGRPCLV
eukprot:1160878-Pelagomonas_calceolata.AAC.6